MTQWTIIFVILKLRDTFRKEGFIFTLLLVLIQLVWPFFQIMREAQGSFLSGWNWLSALYMALFFFFCYQENPDYDQRSNVTVKNTCHPDFLVVGMIYGMFPMRGNFLGNFHSTNKGNALCVPLFLPWLEYNHEV